MKSKRYIIIGIVAIVSLIFFIVVTFCGKGHQWSNNVVQGFKSLGLKGNVKVVRTYKEIEAFHGTVVEVNYTERFSDGYFLDKNLRADIRESNGEHISDFYPPLSTKIEALLNDKEKDLFDTVKFNEFSFLLDVYKMRPGFQREEDKIKKVAIKELVKNPTEEIKTAVIEQLSEEQKETIVEQEIEIVKEELKKDPQFIQICKNKAMSELENIEELEIKIENLSTKKDYLEESMAELEIQHKKQRKELAEEYEREKRRNIERIRQMQNTTYEEQQKNPSFWDSLKERISKSKFISSLIIFKMELDKKIPIPQILSDLKYISKRYDFYMEKPERALEQQEIFEHGYGITIYEHEQDTYGKNQEKEIEDDYNEIEP